MQPSKQQAIDQAIKDHSEVANMEYVSRDLLTEKNMLYGLCYYFSVNFDYVLQWSKLDDRDRPRWLDGVGIEQNFGWMPPIYAPIINDGTFDGIYYDVNEIYVKERLEFLKRMDLKPYLGEKIKVEEEEFFKQDNGE